MKTSYFLILMTLAISGNAQNPLCPYVNAPFSEDFQSNDWMISSSFFGLGSVDSCWNRTPINKIYFKPGPPANVILSGASVDHTLGNSSGKYIFSEIGFGTGIGGTARIISPSIILSSLTNPELSFWYHMFGYQIEDLKVAVSSDSGQTYTNVFTKSGEQQIANTDPWQEAVIDLSNFANDTIIIRFEAIQTTNGSNANICIDDVSVDEKPSCPKPQNLQALTKTDQSVTLNWLAGSPSSTWVIEFGLAGFVAGTGTTITTTSKPVTITGLMPDTTYSFRVKDSCGATSVSPWSSFITVKTDCHPLTAPWSENFEGSNFGAKPAYFIPGTIDPCWARDENVNFMWTAESSGTQSFATGPSNDHTLGNSAGKYLLSDHGFSVSQNISTEIKSQLIDLSALMVPEFRFWYHLYGASIDSLRVEVSDGQSWSGVFSLVGQQQNSNTDAWKEAIVDLSAYANDTIKLRFTSYRSGPQTTQVHAAIDDLLIQEKPSCPAPMNLSVSVTDSSASLSWNSGGANQWILKYRLAGTAQTFTYLTVSNNPTTVTGLNSASLYEFYVRDSCGMSDVSAWLGPEIQRTACVIKTAPWSENLDGVSWIAGNGFSNTGDKIDPCWSRPDTAGVDFSVRSGSTGSSNTGPASDYSGSGNYLFTEASLGLNQTGEISPPLIYLPTEWSYARLKFAYHMYGASINSLEIKIKGGAGSFTSLSTISGAQHVSSTQTWKLDSIDISSYIGDTVQFKFLGSNSGFMADIAIDEISVVGCSNPSADFSFNAQFLETSFDGTLSTYADSLYWDFGDGNNDTARMPTHSYAMPGIYPVTLYAFNDCSLDTMLDTVEVCDSLFAEFHHIVFGDSVYFYSDTSNNALGYGWDMDQGISSSDSALGIKYDSAGQKQITFYTFNACGDTVMSSRSIEICPPPEAHWTYVIISTTSAGMQIQFDGSASLNANKYIWDFGNGTIDSSGAMPLYTFPSPGLHHVVKLKVRNECGAEDEHEASLQSMVGLNEWHSKVAIDVYPNPVLNQLKVDLNPGHDQKLVSISIYSLDGQILYHIEKGHIPPQSLQIDFTKWKEGIYLLKILTHEGTKLVKVRKGMP